MGIPQHLVPMTGPRLEVPLGQCPQDGVPQPPWSRRWLFIAWSSTQDNSGGWGSEDRGQKVPTVVPARLVSPSVPSNSPEPEGHASSITLHCQCAWGPLSVLTHKKKNTFQLMQCHEDSFLLSDVSAV